MSQTMERLFRYKAWADTGLLKDLTALGEDSPITKLAIEALGHSYVVDRIFLAHLRGTGHGFGCAKLTDTPDFHQLSADIRATDQEYLDYVGGLHCDRLHELIDFTFTDGAPGRMSREEILIHVITHGAGHRGQISAVMLLNSVTPAPYGFTTYLHTVEGRDRRRAA
jgi:uncharacterized damage-inducible protein DinB